MTAGQPDTTRRALFAGAIALPAAAAMPAAASGPMALLQERNRLADMAGAQDWEGREVELDALHRRMFALEDAILDAPSTGADVLEAQTRLILRVDEEGAFLATDQLCKILRGVASVLGGLH